MGTQPRYLRADTSPCERINIIDLVGSAEPRERILTDDELRVIWRVTEDDDFPFDPFVRLLILLGCRRASWPECGVTNSTWPAGLWHLSGHRTKNAQPRTFPLSKEAVEIIASLPSLLRPVYLHHHLWPSPISGFSDLKERLVRRIATQPSGGLTSWRLHDVRRTMRTHLSALPISGAVAELMVGHKQQGVRAIYDRWTTSKNNARDLSYGRRGFGALSNRSLFLRREALR